MVSKIEKHVSRCFKVSHLKNMQPVQRITRCISSSNTKSIIMVEPWKNPAFKTRPDQCGDTYSTYSYVLNKDRLDSKDAKLHGIATCQFLDLPPEAVACHLKLGCTEAAWYSRQQIEKIFSLFQSPKYFAMHQLLHYDVTLTLFCSSEVVPPNLKITGFSFINGKEVIALSDFGFQNQANITQFNLDNPPATEQYLVHHDLQKVLYRTHNGFGWVCYYNGFGWREYLTPQRLTQKCHDVNTKIKHEKRVVPKLWSRSNLALLGCLIPVLAYCWSILFETHKS